jgi:hypothetical protein
MTRRTATNALLTLGGVALLVWQIDRIGLAAVRNGLATVGAGILLILLLQWLRFAVRSYAWMRLLDTPAPLSTAVAATVSGDALGNLTPLGLIASEPTKAVYLAPQIEPARALAALTAENFFYSVSVAIYIVLGAAVLLVAFTLPDTVRLSGLVVVAAMACVLGAAAWIAWQRPAAASAVVARLPFRRAAAFVERVREFERQTYGAVGGRASRLRSVVLAELAFHVMSLGECWFTLALLTGRSLPLEALTLDSLNRVINIAFRVIPLRAGVDEVSATALATAIGLDGGTGLVLALVRKVRIIAWAIVGLILWALRGRRAEGSRD